MRVQAISAFNIPKAALPMNISNASNNNANNFKLPGYEVSFGASKAAIRRHKSALDDETRIEIEEAVNTIISDMEFFEDAEEEFLQIDMLVKKFRDNKNALKYIFECSDIKDTPEGASFAGAYLFALKENRDEEDWQKGDWNKFMTNLLCKTKNQTGQTLPQIFATNSNILNEIFNSVSNHPVILYEILTTPDKNGAYLGDIVASGKNKDARKLLNEKLYYIAGLDRSISPKIATRALIANEYILDEANEALLKSF